jgi:hypothetical protein
MTPKKEAERLIDRFYPMFQSSARHKLIKDCALVAVDEIIKSIGFSPNDAYWREVEDEIKKYNLDND